MSVVDDIKGRLDIVETVSGYVALQKSGRYFKAACPFHTEKTPSFIVNPERQSWRCFGACATGGDVFSFVMRMEGMDFGGAIRLLGQKAGIDVSPDRREDGDRTERLHGINRAADDFYRGVLEGSRGKQGRDYLEGRGVDQETSARFEIGISPDGWDGLKSHLLALGYGEDLAVEAGLLVRGEEGRTWDFFRGRLMFPIHDRQGRVAGFGARALDDSMPKYLNTPSTPVFDKRGTVYALHLAGDAIRTLKECIVVEGYMDVVAAHQFGYNNVVASMGTALTEQQVSRLRSLATSFVLALDPDAAGQEATLRSLESSWRVFERQAVDGRRRSVGTLYQREPLKLRIAALPEGRDPDRLIREDRQEWERLTREATPLMDYLIPAVASRFDLTTGQGKTQAVEALFPIIAAAENDFDQDRYLRRLAEALDVGEEALKASVGRMQLAARGRGKRQSDPAPAPEVAASLLSDSPDDSLEDYTLALLLNRPELKDLVKGYAPEYFQKIEGREVFTRWLGCSTIDDLLDSLDESLHPHLRYLTQKEMVPAGLLESERALQQCLRRLEIRYLGELQEGLLASDDAGVPPERDLEGPITDVDARLKELYSRSTR